MAMARIWANRLEAGTKHWDEVPASRKDDVRGILRDDAADGRNGMTGERFQEITGEPYGEA